MIGDSVPWRDELGKAAVRLKRWDTQKRWTERTYFLAERDIMMGAYSIRRLVDSGKSSARLPDKRYRVSRYALKGRVPMVLDRFSPYDFYDIESPKPDELTVARLCNQIVHSFVFQIYLEDDSTTSVVFVSDYDRDKFLYGIRFGVLAELFDYVGREDIWQSDGRMVGGSQTITNTSNHDLVDDGRAVYLDESRTFIEFVSTEAERDYDNQVVPPPD